MTPLRSLLALSIAAAAAWAPAAGAQTGTAPQIGGFRSVLAGGEGQTANAGDVGANQANGTVPPRFVDQQPLYVGIMPKASSLTPADLDVFYKPTAFGSMPGGVGTTVTPRPGAKIVRDKQFGMAHITGDTRADVMFAAGYATAEERLFLMDALRNTAKGTLASLTGAGAASGDAAQLTDQDFSPEELTRQFDELPQRLGAEGARAHQDILDYVDGINAYIDEANLNPTKMPGEYAALGTRPAPWTVADTAAEAVLLVTQFTVSNGGEERNQQLQLAFRKRFGKGWRKPYNDLREAQDPEAFTVAKTTHRSDRPGKRRRGRNVALDLGSITPRNTIVAGPGAAESSQAAARMPRWVRSVIGLKASLPTEESNAVVVSGKLSKDGTPLAAMGPQVSYYSPQIFSEYELHGGGIDVEGVSFPGASPWPLIGHGIDFAWSGTSANGDNNDTFVETLCDDTHYRYKGECVPFVSRDQTVTTPVSAARPGPAADDHLPDAALGPRPGLRLRHGQGREGRADQGQGRRLPRARGGDLVHADGREPPDGRALVHEGLRHVPRHGELVLRRRPRGRLPAVGPLPDAPARDRRRPPAQRRRPRRLAAVRRHRLHGPLPP